MVRIESLASGGQGVGHLDDGRVVFVEQTCPGDVVDIEFTAQKKRWAWARATRVVEPSPDRVPAPCPYFGACGGCQWQHVAYPLQLAAKTRIVSDALQRIGGLDAADLVGECRPSPRQYGYRNKVELVPAQRTPGTSLTLGFHRLGSEDVLPVERCLLLPRRLERAPAKLAGALRYASGARDLGIQRVGLRMASATPDVEVALWTAPSAFPRQVVGKILQDAVAASSVVRVLARDARERHVAERVEVLAGRGHWREKLGDTTYSVSAPSFFQVNTGAAELLVDEAISLLAVEGSDEVTDLYAGVGTFTVPLTKRARRVRAVEGSRFALRDLRRNLDAARCDAELVPGDAARFLDDGGSHDAILVDPPRSGLAPATIDGIVRSRARSLVYVSCDPARLARDARVLADNGLRLSSALPVDLFPQTYHVETVALFERGS
jgi:23S rRNA (uracil1939-C5)-methyltransferase